MFNIEVSHLIIMIFIIKDHLLQRCSKNIKINHSLNKTLFMFIYIHVFKVYEETYAFVCLRSLSNVTKIRKQKTRRTCTCR